MDPCIWGTKLWHLLSEVLRITDPLYQVLPMSLSEQHTTAQYQLLLLYSLQYTLPCIYCRDSYKQYLCDYPPELFLEANEPLTHWLYLVHNLVNEKLEKPIILSLEKYQKRIQQWTTFSDVYGLWDYCTSIAYNFPNPPLIAFDTQGAQNDEYDEKRKNYFLFFDALSFLSQHVPILASVSPFISTHTWDATTMQTKTNFIAWLERQKQAWAQQVHLSTSEKQIMAFTQKNIGRESMSKK